MDKKTYLEFDQDELAAILTYRNYHLESLIAKAINKALEARILKIFEDMGFPDREDAMQLPDGKISSSYLIAKEEAKALINGDTNISGLSSAAFQSQFLDIDLSNVLPEEQDSAKDVTERIKKSILFGCEILAQSMKQQGYSYIDDLILWVRAVKHLTSLNLVNPAAYVFRPEAFREIITTAYTQESFLEILEARVKAMTDPEFIWHSIIMPIVIIVAEMAGKTHEIPELKVESMDMVTMYCSEMTEEGLGKIPDLMKTIFYLN